MAATRSSLVALTLALAGCDAPPAREAAVRDDPGHCREARFEGSLFTLCRYDSRRHALEMISGPRGFAALEDRIGARRTRLRFAMNGGMYDEDGRPIGLFIEDGRTVRRLNRNEGPGNFHLLPNGVFAVRRDGQPIVVRAERWAGTAEGVRWATQSGPMLVIDGRLHPRFSANGESLNIRNGVGAECRAGAHTAWFAISEEAVSFGRFARLFRDALGCRNALFLDGTVSSLWDPGAGRQDAREDLGPLIVVYKKERRPARNKGG